MHKEVFNFINLYSIYYEKNHFFYEGEPSVRDCFAGSSGVLFLL